jgi:hypothetical protein
VNTCQSPAFRTLREGILQHRRSHDSTRIGLTRVGLTRIVIVVMTLALALALSSSAVLAQTAVPFLNAPLSPGVKLPGSATFTLTVYGTGFASDSVVKWNGTALTTTFVSSSEVTASVSAADVATAETGLVTVSNGGVISNTDYFQVVKGGYTVGYGKLDYATDTTPNDVTTADFNGDGILDLAVPTGDNSVSVLLGVGNGTFAAHVEYAVPGHPSAIIHGDFNNDGKMDVATADPYTSEITVLLGNGDGTFQPHAEYAASTQPVALATADVNGDGKLDIIVVNYKANNVSVLIGNGDGSFQAPVDYATGNGPSSVAIGDFNGDGKLDLAVANNTDNTVAILLGNGNGTFQAAVPYPTAVGANSVVAGNFTSANVLDLAVGTSNTRLSVLLGNGNGTFQTHVDYTIGANAVAIATADVNADGKLDLISANYNDDTVSVLLGTGTGTFSKTPSIYPTSSGPSGLAVGDFNNNGKLDIVAAAVNANTVSVLTDNPISITPSVFGFGTQTSGYSYASKPFTLKNSGTVAYTLGSVAFIGTDASDFTLTSNTCSTVAAGKTCTFTVTFSPIASEVANAQMTITATNGSVLAVQLTGKGNIPIDLVPRTMTFPGWQLIGTTSAGKTDTFTNESGVDIYFTLIDLEGANPTEFSFTSTCAGGGPPFNYNVPLLPVAECASTIYFTPTQSGPAHITQVYYGNLSLMKQGLLISGEATAVKVTPTSLTFPPATIGQTTTSVVTFQNAGPTTMPISSAYFSNGTANVFTIQSNTCNFVAGSGGSVPPNSTCTFTLAFTPTVAGTQSATFNIGDPDPAPASTVLVSGTGVAPAN